MGTFHKLLERLGFVRLADYGLLLTADRRVLTTRKAILDDGYGGCVVGWTDGDLATMELAAWGTPKPPPPKALPKPPPRRITASKPVVAEPAPPPPPEPVVAPEPVAPPPEPITPPAVAVAPEPPVEEDEWEWEIAMARARAAVDEVVAEADAMIARRPVAVVARTPVAPIREPLPLPAQPANDDSRPPTIIPVPALPAIDPRLVRSYEAPRRFPRATAERAALPPPHLARR